MRPWCTAAGPATPPAARPDSSPPPRPAAAKPPPPTPPAPPVARSTRSEQPSGDQSAAGCPSFRPPRISRPREPVAVPVARPASGTQARPPQASTGWRPPDSKRPTTPEPSGSRAPSAPRRGGLSRAAAVAVPRFSWWSAASFSIVGLTVAGFVLALLSIKNSTPTATEAGTAKASASEASGRRVRGPPNPKAPDRKKFAPPFVAERSPLDDLDPMLIPQERRTTAAPDRRGLWSQKHGAAGVAVDRLRGRQRAPCQPRRKRQRPALGRDQRNVGHPPFSAGDEAGSEPSWPSRPTAELWRRPAATAKSISGPSGQRRSRRRPCCPATPGGPLGRWPSRPTASNWPPAARTRPSSSGICPRRRRPSSAITPATIGA